GIVERLSRLTLLEQSRVEKVDHVAGDHETPRSAVHRMGRIVSEEATERAVQASDVFQVARLVGSKRIAEMEIADDEQVVSAGCESVCDLLLAENDTCVHYCSGLIVRFFEREVFRLSGLLLISVEWAFR